MKSKAHYKKCIELRIMPVPTSVCEENIDREALKQLVLNGASTGDSSSSDDESEADVDAESDESGNEEHEAAESLLRLAARPLPSNDLFISKHPRLLGLLSSNRPAAYPYGQLQANLTDHSTKNEEYSILGQTAIDLTTDKLQHPTSLSTEEVPESPVSGSKFLQTLVKTMERLPIGRYPNCNWQVSEVTQDHMFQAYLTERHLMNRKLKQHCHVIVSSIDSDTLKSEQRNDCSKRIESQSHHESYNLKSVEQLDLSSILPAPKVVVNRMGFIPSSSLKQSTEFIQPSLTEEAKNICGVCSKVFSKPSQLRLHINIHYFERPFRCESCGTSFRTKGHLTKHERSTLHHNKVNMTSTFGAATASNPRPFKCVDCKSAFRIHGHLAKHLRSKMHIMKLECLRKLPFGTYAEMEKSCINLNEIDTTDCDTSLSSLQIMAQKLYKKDSSSLNWDCDTIPSNSIVTTAQTSILSTKSSEASESSSDEGGRDRVASIPLENNHPYHSINIYRASTSKESDLQDGTIRYKCHFCTTSVRNVGELELHCFEEHRIESSETASLIFRDEPVFSPKVEDSVKNKENAELLTIFGKSSTKKGS